MVATVRVGEMVLMASILERADLMADTGVMAGMVPTACGEAIREISERFFLVPMLKETQFASVQAAAGWVPYLWMRTLER